MAKSTHAIASLACALALAAPLGAGAAAKSICRAPSARIAPVYSPPRLADVVGAGRLRFYRAPDLRCPLPHVYIVGGESVTAQARTRSGWTSVSYFNPNTASSAAGWVRSYRLKLRGAITGPQY